MNQFTRSIDTSMLLAAWEQDLYSENEIASLYAIPVLKVRKILRELSTIRPEEQKRKRAEKQRQLWQEVGPRLINVVRGLSQTDTERVYWVAAIRKEFPQLSPETIEMFLDRSIGLLDTETDLATSLRDREIVAAWECEIITLDALGKRFGLTRERIRQILKNNGAKTKAEIREMVREEQVVRFAKKRDLLMAELKQLSQSQLVTKAEAARMLADKFPEFPGDMVRKFVGTSGIPLPNKRAAAPNTFSSIQLELAVLLCFGLCYPRALETKDYAEFVAPSHEAELRRFSESDSFPTNVEFSKILNAVGFSSLKRKQNVLDPFAHGDYERRRMEIWSENGWGSGAGGRYWPPTQQTISKRIGGGYWNDAMQRLGFPTSAKKGRPRVGYLHNEESLLDSLEHFLLHCTEHNQTVSPSVQAYELWRSRGNANDANHASVATIRSHFGSWNQAIHSATTRNSE